MKKFIKNTSPFLLLTIPFFVALVLMGLHSGSEMIQEKIQLSASFIKLPEVNIFHVIFRW
ncbi:MAG TPA: hypothetical protein VKZ78_08120 [Sphingobacteriaceae bacterium]|nr:hypothetical protein [Sphingobacteriaceae bacterium]